jgi:hypothetical protein
MNRAFREGYDAALDQMSDGIERVNPYPEHTAEHVAWECGCSAAWEDELWECGAA